MSAKPKYVIAPAGVELMRTTEPDPARVKTLASVLHDQGIGCNYRAVTPRRYHNEPGGDPEGFTVRLVYDDPEPTGYDSDGWKHEGDHDLVARTMLDCGLVRFV